jgi:mRNA deadenylase 3'-5' endonuclease subunit Ccr4
MALSCAMHSSLSSAPSFSLLSFNVLAPCYNKLSLQDPLTGARTVKHESDLEEVFLARNSQICSALLALAPDIICLQEFWHSNPKLVHLYESQMGDLYEIRYLRRSRQRKDGLAVLVKRAVFKIEDEQDIMFQDCGDRVALLLLLSLQSSKEACIVVNTHLLYPYNANSTKISIREMAKVLGFLQLYQPVGISKEVKISCHSI